MFLPLGIVGLTFVAYKVKTRGNYGVLTKDRKDVFDAAMRHLKDPEKLRTLALAYEKAGCKAEAILLRKRANLRALPPNVKAARRAAFRKFMTSTNADSVEKIAAVFEREGAVGTAEELCLYARGLRMMNPADIENMALMYEGRGHADTAAALRKRAEELKPQTTEVAGDVYVNPDGTSKDPIAEPGMATKIDGDGET